MKTSQQMSNPFDSRTPDSKTIKFNNKDKNYKINLDKDTKTMNILQLNTSNADFLT